ncbi:unnamed protein product [Dovyalis caffra]|uniref:Uncharacterized protein n=1 Tax=Dovyalis caffra TaxID=77055 RepID=A0AAV1RUB3_9ROSI|nr:unnamed protein product [Dovyalis caffra]
MKTNIESTREERWLRSTTIGSEVAIGRYDLLGESCWLTLWLVGRDMVPTSGEARLEGRGARGGHARLEGMCTKRADKREHVCAMSGIRGVRAGGRAGVGAWGWKARVYMLGPIEASCIRAGRGIVAHLGGAWQRKRRSSVRAHKRAMASLTGPRMGGARERARKRGAMRGVASVERVGYARERRRQWACGHWWLCVWAKGRRRLKFLA